MQRRISLAELIDSDTYLRPDEAVAILREVCRQYAAGELRGIPNAAVIRLTPDGRVSVEGPVNRDQDAVHAAATLLNELLPGFDAPGGFKVPGGLRLVLARATRTLDLPPFQDVGELCAALERFAAADLAPTVSALYATHTARRQAPGLPAATRETTISDIRRARRATGLSLEDVAQAAGVPAAKLRELEWGYMRNWPADDASRDEIRRYARVTGLDERLVLSTAWPLIEGAADSEPPVEAAVVSSEWTLVPQPSQSLVPLRWPAPAVPAPARAWRRHGWMLALAAAMILVVLSMAAWFPRRVAPPVLADSGVPVVATPPVAARVLDGTAGAPDPAEGAGARPAAYVRPAPARPAALKARPQAKGKSRSAPQRKSFFKRELFRIVIK
jgi:hypothetical protein